MGKQAAAAAANGGATAADSLSPTHDGRHRYNTGTRPAGTPQARNAPRVGRTRSTTMGRARADSSVGDCSSMAVRAALLARATDAGPPSSDA